MEPSVYRANGFAVFRLCGRHDDRKLVVQYGIEPYERKQDFSLLFGKYWSKSQTVSEKKFSVRIRKIVGGVLF